MDFNWQGKVILIAEDEPANFLFVKKVLETTNVTVLGANSGSEAIECVQNNTDIDLVLMDIFMPEMDGFEASRIIKEIKPELPIIAQTCYDIDIDENKLDQARFNDFIRKPININKLLVIVEKHLKISLVPDANI